MIELVNHEAILCQMREDFSVEIENAVKEAVANERQQLEAKFSEEVLQMRGQLEQEREQLLRQGRLKTEAEKQILFNEALKRVISEKERQVEELRSREEAFRNECERHKQTIYRLTQGSELRDNSGDGTSTVNVWSLINRVEALERDKANLESELLEQKRRVFELQRHAEMSASVAVVM